MKLRLLRLDILSILLTAIVIGIAYACFSDKEQPFSFADKGYNQSPFSDGGSVHQISDTVSGKVKEGLLGRVKAMEYHFTRQGERYHCPNREQSIRSYFSPGKWELEDRSNKDNWDLSLTTNKVMVDGISLIGQTSDSVRLNDNHLEMDLGSYVEEYENTPEGTRQNFIVRKPRGVQGATCSQISVELGLSSSSPKFNAKQNSEGLEFDFGNGHQLLYKGLKVWDAAGKDLPSKMDLDGDKVVLTATLDASTVFPVTIDPIISSGNPSNANAAVESNQASSLYGYSVSSAGDVNGDGYSDVIVGAPNYDNGQTDEGAVYIYHGSSTGISTTAALMMESNQASSMYGLTVSSAGDVNGDGYSDIVIGAMWYDNGTTDEGVAFVHHGSSSGVSSTPAKTLEMNQFAASYGCSVSSAGDVNGDGYSDIIVGANAYDNGQSNEGVMFVYHGSSSGVSTTAATMLESNQANAYFGYSVSSAGDVNGDGYSDVIVSAPYYDNGQTDEGTIYVYLGTSSGLSTSYNVMLESNQASSQYGIIVSSAGDVNGDGYSDVIVGANVYDNGQTDEGMVFVYHGSASGVNSFASLTLESNQTSARMGSVSSAGDVNGDGYSDIIVGAYFYDNGNTDEGAAFVYHGSSGGILGTYVAAIEGNQNNVNMGYSVSSAGDVNGDGFSDIIVGGPYYSNGQSYEGGAFVYHGSSSTISTTASTMVESNQTGAYAGSSVSYAGDVNGDGYSDVIVGAPYFDNGQSDEGVAFVYHGSVTGLSSTAAVMLESNLASSQFGLSVSTAGDVNGDGYADVAVGAPYYSNGQSSEGAVFVYHGSASGVSATAATVIESNQASAMMGYSVASAGDVNLDAYADIIVGVYTYTNGQTNEGAAFVYHGSSSGLSTTAATVLECNQASALLGCSVSSAGDVNGDGYSDVIVGAMGYSNGQASEGAAFVYLGSSSGVPTTAATVLESNQAYAYAGLAVSSAGDVNGDGYSDVIVGSPNYDNGQTDEGAAFVYLGSSSGVSTSASFFESNQANANYGYSVSSAGDVNGDGYSDVTVAAPYYDNGQADEGAVYVYHGSASGLAGTPAAIAESNINNGNIGWSVSSAGDVNGDGYSDIIAGCPIYANGQSAEGAAFLYRGNNASSAGRSRLLNVYGLGTTTPIKAINNLDKKFTIGLFSKPLNGNRKVKLVWETRGNGVEYSHNSPITNSTAFTGRSSTWTTLPVGGTQVTADVDKISTSVATKVRARIMYSPATSTEGEVYGPWTYFNINPIGGGNTLIPLPVELIYFDLERQKDSVKITWQYEEIGEAGVYYNLYKSADGKKWKPVRMRLFGTNGQDFLVKDKMPESGFYKLEVMDPSGAIVDSHLRFINGSSAEQSCVLYPQPCKDQLFLVGNLEEVDHFDVISEKGELQNDKVTFIKTGNTMEMDISSLPMGVYMIKFEGNVLKFIKYN